MKICNKENCYGCNACVNVCPKKVIEVKNESDGFLYPEIDEKECVNCGMCTLVCPGFDSNLKSIVNKVNIKEYACTHLNCDVISTSQSGGAFYGLAEVVLNKRGIVYGAAFDTDNKVSHLKVENVEDLWKLQGSKYVQSDIGSIFQEIGKYLLSKNKVLFSGTSCQVAGLNLYLNSKNISQDDLITCDFICHGVPSPIVFKEYIAFLEKKYKAKINHPNLRDKKMKDWKTPIESYKDSNDNIHTETLWNELFYSDMILRISCGNCKFNKEYYVSDITIGDFWGGEKYIDDFSNYPNGISVVLAHTIKGNKLIKEGKFNLQEIQNYDQKNLNISTTISHQSDNFWRTYYEKGFEFALKRFTSYGGVVTKVKRKVLRKLKKW